jgi:hypothetical protein
VKARSRRKKGRKRRRGQAKKEGEEQNSMKGTEEEPEEEEKEEEGQGQEEEQEEEIEEEAGEEAIRSLDRKIAYVGGLLVERARRLARFKELVENPGKALGKMEEEEETAVVVLGEDTLPSVVGMLRRRGREGGVVEDNRGSGSSSYRWLRQALDQYLQPKRG